MCSLPVGYLIYHKQESGWLGATGFYRSDYQAPLAPGETKTWPNIRVWVNPGKWDFTNNPSVMITVSTPSGSPLMAPPEWSYRLYLDYVPSSVSYDGPWEWEIDPTKDNLIVLPAFASATGTDGYKLRFTAAGVPEPAGLLVLAGALGFAGAIRRRR